MSVVSSGGVGGSKPPFCVGERGRESAMSWLSDDSSAGENFCAPYECPVDRGGDTAAVVRRPPQRDSTPSLLIVHDAAMSAMTRSASAPTWIRPWSRLARSFSRPRRDQ